MKNSTLKISAVAAAFAGFMFATMPAQAADVGCANIPSQVPVYGGKLACYAYNQGSLILNFSALSGAQRGRCVVGTEQLYSGGQVMGIVAILGGDSSQVPADGFAVVCDPS